MHTRRSAPLLLLLLVLLPGAVPAAQEVYRLASAQVVTATDRPPVLKLTASGPIAFRVVPAEETGVPASPHRLTARLYGVMPGELATLTGLAPFDVTTTGMGNDTMVTVSASGLPAAATLSVRTGMRSNELEVVIAVPAQD
jgi:hypothetical protein